MKKWLVNSALALSIAGGLDWGIVGLTGLFGSRVDILQNLLGSVPFLLNIVYLLVGLSALSLFHHWKER